MGTSFFRDDDGPRAIQALQRAVQLDPYDVDAWIQLGPIDERENRLSDASQSFHQRPASITPFCLRGPWRTFTSAKTIQHSSVLDSPGLTACS